MSAWRPMLETGTAQERRRQREKKKGDIQCRTYTVHRDFVNRYVVWTMCWCTVISL
jgi:hypothetical protein